MPLPATPHDQSTIGSRTRHLRPSPRALQGRSGLLIVLLLGLALRLALFPVKSFIFDRAAFTEWMIALQTHPLADFYSLPLTTPADHLPGTLWLLTGIGSVVSWLGVAGPGGMAGLDPHDAQPFLKVLPIVADLVCGVLIHGIVRRIAPDRPRAALLATAGWVLAPGAIFISAIWGQWDAISLGFVLAAILAALHGRRGALFVPPLLALAMLMKPQFGLLAPLLGLFVLVNAGLADDQRSLPRTLAEGRARVLALWRGAGKPLLIGGLLAVAVVTLAGWPFHVGLIPLPIDGWQTYAERATFAANRFPGTTYGAVSLWLIPLGTHYPPDDAETLLGPLTAAGLGWGLVFASAIVGLIIAQRYRWSGVGLIVGSTVTYLGFILFATRMHERYLLPALALTVLVAALRPVWATIASAIALSLAYLVAIYFSFGLYTIHVRLPLLDLRTGPVLSLLGAIGVGAFLVLLIGVWSPRPAPRPLDRRRHEVEPRAVEIPTGQSANAGD